MSFKFSYGKLTWHCQLIGAYFSFYVCLYKSFIYICLQEISISQLDLGLFETISLYCGTFGETISSLFTFTEHKASVACILICQRLGHNSDIFLNIKKNLYLNYQNGNSVFILLHLVQKVVKQCSYRKI